MSDKPGSPSEKAFTEDLVRLDAELAGRVAPPATTPPENRPSLIAGLVAGMTHVGRPAR